MVLGKAFLRRADGADDFRAQILFAADPIVNFFRERIVKKPVDGEIAAQRVGLGAGENDLLRTPAIPVIRLGPERGDLELLFAFDDDHHAEFAPDGDGAFEKLFNLLRLGVRGDVEIVRLASEQKSRTQPPTQNAAKPACCRRRAISTAVSLSESGFGPGILRFQPTMIARQKPLKFASRLIET